MPFSVRIAGFNDIIEMSNLLNDIIIEGGSTLQNRIFTAMEFEKYFFKNQFAICIHVAVQGDSIIGFQFLEWSDPNWSGIDKLPSNWGLIATYISKTARRLGAGKKLFGATKSYASKIKMCSINATISSFNKEAIKFYDSLGFYEYAQYENQNGQNCISKRFDLCVE
jgi:GNAT superfamily N-acetyltransferase